MVKGTAMVSIRPRIRHGAWALANRRQSLIPWRRLRYHFPRQSGDWSHPDPRTQAPKPQTHQTRATLDQEFPQGETLARVPIGGLGEKQLSGGQGIAEGIVGRVARQIVTGPQGVQAQV